MADASTQRGPTSSSGASPVTEGDAGKDWLQKLSVIPGALMLVPLFLGAIVNTFFPQVLDVGSFTTALFRDGTAALLGLFFFCLGSQLNVRSTGPTLEKGITVRGIFGRRLWDTWEQLLLLLQSGRIDLDWLVTHRFALDQAEAAVDLLTGDAGKVLLVPSLGE